MMQHVQQCIVYSYRNVIAIIPAGYFYLVVEEDGSINTTMAYSTTARTSFIKGSEFPQDDTV